LQKRKKGYLCEPEKKKKSLTIEKHYPNEKDLPTIEEEKKKQARF
jgi:hypothetical protein